MLKPKYTVDVLQEEDIKWFVEVAAVDMLVNEVKRPDYVDLDTMYALSYKCIEDGTAFVVKKDGLPIGAIGSMLTHGLYNPKIKMLVELFWYVSPEHRESRAGYMLLKAFENKAKECADEATLTLMPSSRVGIDTLNKRGWNLAEFSFHRRV